MSARFERERADARVRRPLRRVVHVVLRQKRHSSSSLGWLSPPISLFFWPFGLGITSGADEDQIPNVQNPHGDDDEKSIRVGSIEPWIEDQSSQSSIQGSMCVAIRTPPRRIQAVPSHAEFARAPHPQHRTRTPRSDRRRSDDPGSRRIATTKAAATAAGIMSTPFVLTPQHGYPVCVCLFYFCCITFYMP